MKNFKSERERIAKGIYEGEYRLKWSDIDWVTSEGKYLYKKHGKGWTLRDTMNFIMEFEDILQSADWEELFVYYQLINLGEFYDVGLGEVVEMGEDEYEEFNEKIEKMRVYNLKFDINEDELPF